ncbi:MAG: hypothetical protein K2P70_17090 [Hyphomonadaceae bacterium]|nr:hypothetical protein [Hyphomonadaceae bacterium]
MSERRVERALARMAATGALLTPDRGGTRYALFPNNDRRRRPLVRLNAEEARALEASGALASEGAGYAITKAGRALVARETASPGEAFLAQHRPIIDRAVIEADGRTRVVRGHDADAILRRLAALRDGNGAAWLDSAEIAAAARLRRDWEMGERGLVRGSDWTAPPNGAGPRGPSNRAEQAAGAYCDARQRVSDALARLAVPLRRVVERVCLREEGLEALERGEGWPARSGKIALKLALAQLAAN